MGHGGNKKQRLRKELEEAQLRKRSGLIRLILAIVIFIVVTAIKQAAVVAGVAIASHMVTNAAFYIMALVLAGVAGYGARDYVRANNDIRALNAKLTK